MKKEMLVSSLAEFKHLTFNQVKLLSRVVKDDRDRTAMEKKLNDELRQRRGGEIRVVEG
jgi:hypothetical protein